MLLSKYEIYLYIKASQPASLLHVLKWHTFYFQSHSIRMDIQHCMHENCVLFSIDSTHKTFHHRCVVIACLFILFVRLIFICDAMLTHAHTHFSKAFTCGGIQSSGKQHFENMVNIDIFTIMLLHAFYVNKCKYLYIHVCFLSLPLSHSACMIGSLLAVEVRCAHI